jgi:hypothetical protein
MWLFVAVLCRTTSVQDLLYLQCPRECPSIRAPGPNQRFDDQEWRQPGGPEPQEEEIDSQADRPDSTGKLAAQVRRKFLLRLLKGHISADFTTDKGRAAALRVILEWLATTHESVLSKHDPRSAVHAWYRTNGVDFGRHDANVLSLMTTAVNKAGLAVPKAGIPAVKREDKPTP